MTQKTKLALSIAVIIIFAAVLHSSISKIADADSFYHIRHAWIYRTEGIFNNSFPWTQYSVIGKIGADIWYGFHMLILPFTFFSDLVVGIKIGAAAVTAGSLFIAFWAFKRLKVAWPIFWTFVLVFASADLMYRMTMMRPHPLSLAISLLLFSYLVTEKTRRSYLAVFLLSAAFSWIHLALSWLPIVVAGTVFITEWISQRRFFWQYPLLVLGGLLAGAFLRPNPVGAIKIAYIQVVQLFIEKLGSELPLRFGRELLPFVWENFADQLVPITVLVFIGVGLALKLTKNRVVWTGFVLTALFFILAFTAARRANDIFIGFAVIFVALVLTEYFNVKKKNPPLLILAFIIIFLVMPIKNTYRFLTYQNSAIDPLRFQPIGEWLHKNSKPGEIVFNIHWDRFAELFFWNHHNYYINGMDPIFEYAYEPSLYWKTHFFAIDAADKGYTCPMVRCTLPETVNNVEVIKNDFKASYVLVEKLRSPKIYNYFLKTPSFRKAFETEQDVLFKVL